MDAGEECDDANTDDRDGCEHDCTLACGSGTGAHRAFIDDATGHCLAGFTATTSCNDADVVCAGLGGYLVSLLDETESMIASRLMSGEQAFSIGLSDLVTEGAFAWQGGDSLSFTDWCIGEPAGGALADCVVMRTDMLCWQNVDCEDLFAHVCEIP